jgi:microtubule-associated protein-like 6
MGCVPGAQSVETMGGLEEDQAFADDNNSKRTRYNKKTGQYEDCQHGENDAPEDDFFAAEDAGAGEQFLSVRPWIGQIAEPDSHNDVSPDQPDETYVLDYVLGYRCADSRQNVHINPEGQFVYMTAALGVVLDHSGDVPTQKFFGGGEVDNTAKNVANDKDAHTDDIMCLGLSEDRSTVLTGQVGKAPAVFLWDSVSAEKKQQFKLARGSRGVSACGISVDGSMIAVADLHDNHKVHCFNSDGTNLFT